MKPVWVAISGAEKPLSAGKAYSVECSTGGSRPAANVHWYLRSALQPATERVSSVAFCFDCIVPFNRV